MSGRLRNFTIIWAAMLSTLAVQVDGAGPLYVGTGSGLYKSTDAGASWTQVTVPLTSALLSGQLNVLAVRKSPQNPSTIYFVGLAKARAFFATQDGGQTWTATPFVGISPTSMGINGLEVDFAGQVIYLTASTAGSSASLLYKSTDVGVTWTQLKISNTAAFSPAVKIVADPLVSGTLYTLTSNDEFLKSTDFGGSWTKIGGPGITQTAGGVVPQTTILNIKVDPRNPLIWYFGTDHNSSPATCPLTNGGLCGLFRSTDGGATFTGLSIPINYVSSVSFGAVSSTVYATGNVAGLGPTLMRSIDSGNTWTPLVNGLFTAQSGEVWADPSDASTIYVDDNVFSNTSFYVSTDGGATFPQRATPLGPPGCVPGNCARQPINDLLIVAASGPLIGGVVNGGSFVPNQPISPGCIVSIFGSNLAGQNSAASQIPLPLSLNQVSVKINGEQMPLYFVSSTQINVQAPWDLATNGPATIIVNNNGANSPPFSVGTSGVSPAVLAYLGEAIAINLDGTLALASGAIPGLTSHPAARGQAILLYTTGLGPVTSSVPLGGIPPSGTIVYTKDQPTVLLNGTAVAAASVIFSGLTPQFVGVNQLNIIIPPDAPTGNSVSIQLSMGGLTSPAAGAALAIQ